MFRCCVVSLFLFGFIGFAAAQDGYVPRSLSAFRLPADQQITIDGRLDEAIWRQVEIGTDFRQVDPDEGTTPGFSTQVRVAYSATTLYVAWDVDETGQTEFTRAIRERDGQVWQDDNVRLSLDPHRTGRNTYNFTLNANGARLDFLYENNITITSEWNTDWQARVYRHENGWTAEMAIPFRVLSYPGNGEDWGIEFARIVQRDFELNRWSGFSRNLGGLNASNMGRLTGIEGIERGLGLDVETFTSARLTHIWPEEFETTDLDFGTSGNAYYKITDGLTGTLTVNTDFSDAPADPRIVSTSRFATFFDETRDFFLQDSAIFEFGGRGFADDGNGTPFSTRRIGLVDGQIVDLVGGVKLSGRLGGFDVGGLVTQMGEGIGIETQRLGVGRISRGIGENAKIGAMMVMGDPTGETHNTVAGLDYQIQHDLKEDVQLSAEVYLLDSYTGDDLGVGDNHGQAWGGVFRYTSDPLFLQFTTKHLEEGYDPALGFVNRPEIRRFELVRRQRWRPSGTIFRTIENWQWYDTTTNLRLETESRSIGTSVEGQFRNRDEYGIVIAEEYEFIRDPFDLPDNVTVEAGEYWTRNIRAWYEGANRRVLKPRIEIMCCGLFDGDYLRIEGDLRWRPIPLISLAWNNTWQHISLSTGSTEIYVTSIENTISFTPDMQLITDIQYDNLSGNMNIFSRYRWEFAPGSELFVGLGHNADVPARDFANEFSSNVSTLTVRLGRTFSY